jgi:hypothetical protein
MSSFTTRLKSAITISGGTLDYKPMAFDGVRYSKLPFMTDGNIGLNDYPIFDEAYRQILNGKIIDHYFMREIGTETIDMFQLFMRRKMQEIMPFYNQMYKSTQIEFEPLLTINMESTGTNKATESVTADNTTEATSDSTSKSRAVNSQTPQTMLSGDEDYASSASDSNSDQTGTSNATQNNKSDSTSEADSDNITKGYQGLASDLIMRYRDSFLNIDMTIINELEECFMLVWDTTDEYARHNSLYWY